MAAYITLNWINKAIYAIAEEYEQEEPTKSRSLKYFARHNVKTEKNLKAKIENYDATYRHPHKNK